MKVEHLISGNYYHIYNRGNNRMNLFSIPADFEHFLELYDKYISPVADTLSWVLMPNHFHVLVYIKKDVVYKYSLETLNRIAPDKIWFEEHKWETVSIDLSACAAPDNVGIGKNNTNENSNVGIGMKNIDKNVNAVKSKDVDRLEEEDLSAFAEFRQIGTGPDNVETAKTDNIEIKDFNADRSVDAVGLAKPDNVKVGKKPVPYRHFSHLFNAYTRYYHNRTGGCGNLFERPFKRKIVDTEEYLKKVILYIHNNPVHHGFCDHPLEYPWSSFITCVSDKPTKLKRRAVVKLFENNQQFETEHLKPVDTEQMDKWLDIDVDYTTDINNRTTPDLSAYAVFRQIGTGPDNVDGKKKEK